MRGWLLCVSGWTMCGLECVSAVDGYGTRIHSGIVDFEGEQSLADLNGLRQFHRRGVLDSGNKNFKRPGLTTPRFGPFVLGEKESINLRDIRSERRAKGGQSRRVGIVRRCRHTLNLERCRELAAINDEEPRRPAKKDPAGPHAGSSADQFFDTEV